MAVPCLSAEVTLVVSAHSSLVKTSLMPLPVCEGLERCVFPCAQEGVEIRDGEHQ